jgi:predicted aspartyl protease
VSVKRGQVVNGHPYIKVIVSADGKTGSTFPALVDTGFSGFISVPVMTGSLLGLRVHTTAIYTLANGKPSDPIPLAYGYACLEGDGYIQGLISFGEHTSTIVGVDFLMRCGKVLVLSPKGFIMISESDLAPL